MDKSRRESGRFASSPMVVDSVMYFSAPNGVYAIDAVTGIQIGGQSRRHRRRHPRRRQQRQRRSQHRSPAAAAPAAGAPDMAGGRDSGRGQGPGGGFGRGRGGRGGGTAGTALRGPMALAGRQRCGAAHLFDDSTKASRRSTRRPGRWSPASGRTASCRRCAPRLRQWSTRTCSSRRAASNRGKARPSRAGTSSPASRCGHLI